MHPQFGAERERSFAKFLQHARDVVAFAKLPDPIDFTTEYTDTVVNLRLYYPDFVARLDTGEHWLLVTKGQEHTDVARKDAVAQLCCEKVGQKAFASLPPDGFGDLLALG